MAIVLRPHGKLDLKEAVKLKQKIHEVSQSGELENHQFWIVDLAKVNDIDHFGAIALLEARRYAQQRGHKLLLSNVNTTVRSVFNIAHLTQEFEFITNNESLPEISQVPISSPIPERMPSPPQSGQFPIPASPHSHRLYKTLASLKSRLVERSEDLPVSV